MVEKNNVLLCWHSERAGVDVLKSTLKAMLNRRIEIQQVLYLTQSAQSSGVPGRIGQTEIKIIAVPLDDPTQHAAIYNKMHELVLPILKKTDADLHINVSPGTPAMHSVWLILHAGGALPAGSRLWSSQLSSDSGRRRIDPVTFPISTYLAEIRQHGRSGTNIEAAYEPEAKSESRRTAFEQLNRYSRVPGAPLLILGERGTGKTRLVESFVATLKGRKNVVTVPCGGLTSELAESLLFGHLKGAFTGATTDRTGLLAEANGGILFLDEVQDLPTSVQRKLVRVFQDRQRRYRPVGSDKEQTSDFDVVCASNLIAAELRMRLDLDFYDRLSHLTVTVPPLRECRDDVKDDWRRVWVECCQSADLPQTAPLSAELDAALLAHALPGNLRDLQRLALLCLAWWDNTDSHRCVNSALDEWMQVDLQESPTITLPLGEGTRKERVKWFQARLAKWAKEKYGTWSAAAQALECDVKTLRVDVDNQ